MQADKQTTSRRANPSTKVGRVVGYCRVSTVQQADAGESLLVQQRQIEGWCHMAGQTLSEVFVERGVSGSLPLAERPEGSRLWTSLRAGDTVVVAKLDRLFRSALDALQAVEALKQRGVHLVLLDLGGDISGNGLSRLFLTIAAAFAEAERDRIRERITQVKRDQRGRGRYLGGKVPFGFRPTAEGGLEAVPEEQAVIATACQLRSKGASLRAIRDAVAEQHGSRLSLDALARVTRDPPG
ncbi:recombinase family protein [Pseudoroseomonas sp. WGS1072]|uniref:recombinase family protein n=1 Tax=Roseomonas sp. WGS1072 TaxID=3366816 RepID=UPI003BF16FA3